jgi:hypothetical protein
VLRRIWLLAWVVPNEPRLLPPVPTTNERTPLASAAPDALTGAKRS